MRNKYLIASVLIIICFGILWGYLRLNERIILNLNNETQSVLTWQWSCNSEPKSEPSAIKANSNVEVTVYPSCEGEIGIIVSAKENSHYERLISYVPTGKPEIVLVNMSAFNQVEVKIKN